MAVKNKFTVSLPPKKFKRKPAPALALYRRIAVSFVVVVAVMLAVVLYVSTVRATVRITPVTTSLETKFILDIVQTPVAESEIGGQLVSGTLGRTQTFTPSGQGSKTVEAKAAGTVTIFNTTEKAQALVATTRLLTPEGVLFRIDKSVTVPAKGQVEVSAHADKPGASGDISPSKFTIPGLAAALQSVIYAESKEAFQGGVISLVVISQEEIEASYTQLQTALENDAKSMLRAEIKGDFKGETFYTYVLSQKSSVKAGSEAGSYELTMNLKMIGVFYNQPALEEMAILKLYEKLEPGMAFDDVKKSDLKAVVQKYDVGAQKANVSVTLQGVAKPSTTNRYLDPALFAGKSQEQIQSALVEKNIATKVEVFCSPFWIKKVPQLRDHIYVEIL